MRGAGFKRRPARKSVDNLDGCAWDGGQWTRRVPAGRRATGESSWIARQKAKRVTALGGIFKATKVVVVAHYSGLTVAQMQTLRRQMKQAGASVKVAKNRLAKIALEGSDVASIAPLLKGPALIAAPGDPVAAPKAAARFRRGDRKRLVIPGGAMGDDGAGRRTGSRRSPPCRRWTNCGPSSSAWSRRRRPRSRRCSAPPAAQVGPRGAGLCQQRWRGRRRR